MVQKTDLNVSPYYDDFDETDNFHRTLFRPGFAIQARELTQLQSVLQGQIEKHGSHIFREGAVVIPGATNLNTSYYSLKLASLFASETVDPSQYFNSTTPVTITGETTGVTAVVVGFDAATTTEQPTLYVRYVNSGTNNETAFFADGENISADAGITHTTSYSSGVASATTFTSTFSATAGSSQAELASATGPASRIGSAVHIQAGVYYIRGFFVNCSEETLVLDKYDRTPSYRVGFTVTETLVTPESDTTLLDNATGSSNFAAKGAHRLKISLSLAKLARGSTADSNFVELMDIKDGIVQSQVRFTEYNVLEETLARRTFDESGDYTVRPFQFQVRESVDTSVQNEDFVGAFTAGETTDDGNTADSSLLGFQVSPGKAFVRGFEIEKIAPTIKDINKARDFNTVNAGVSTFDVGNFALITNVYGTPDVTFISGETTAFKEIQFFSNKFTTRGTKNGNLVGVARARTIQYHSGTAGSSSSNNTSQYKLFMFDIQPFTKLTLSGTPSPTLLANHSTGGVQIKGVTSGATGFVFDEGTSQNVINLTNVVGEFSAGEKITASDSAETDDILEDSSNADLTISTVDRFQFSDFRSVFMEDTDSGQNFTADFVLESASGEIGTILLETGTGETEGAQIQLETGTPDSTQGTDVIELETRSVARLKDTQKNRALFKLPKQVIKTLLTTDNAGATDTQYTVRRQFVGTTNASGVVTFNAGSNETFVTFAEKDFTLSILSAGDGTGAQGDIVSLSGKLSGTGSGALTVTDNTILGDSAKVKLTATILKTSVTQKTKTTNLMKQLKVLLTDDDGAFGIRSTDRTISLGRADVFNLVAVFDSQSSSDAVAPTLTVTGVSGTFTRGEIITGGSTGATARIINTTSPFSFVSKKGVFTVGETITGQSSSATGTISAKTLGDDVITSRFELDTGMRDNYYDIARIVRKPGRSAPTGRLLVIYDYFEHGSGDVMTVDSFSDIAKQMEYEDIPIYSATRVDPDAPKPSGVFPLTDVFDFRPRVADIAGTSSTLETVDQVTGSSFNFESRTYSGTGSSTVDPCQPGCFLQADFEYFLPKRAVVSITSSGTIIVNEGVGAEEPLLPKSPDNAMKLAELFLPAYTFKPTDVQVRREKNQRFTMRDIGKLEKRLDNVEFFTALNMLERDAESFEVTDANGLNRFKAGFVVDNFSGHRVGDTVHKDYEVSIDMQKGHLRPKHTTKGNFLEENASTTTARTNAGYQKTGDLITLPYTETTEITQPYASRVEKVVPLLSHKWNGQIELTPSSDEWFEVDVIPELVINVEGNFQAVLNANRNQLGTIWNSWETQWVGGEQTREVDQGDRRVITTSRNEGLTRTGIRTEVIERVDRESQGFKVLERAVIPVVRSRSVSFVGNHFRPNTRVFAFFDKVDVNTHVTPASSSFSDVATPIAGSKLITDPSGKVEGTFLIPDPKVSGNLQFKTGEIQFRLTSSPNNLEGTAASVDTSSTDDALTDRLTTAGNAIYFAKGILETQQETIIATRNAEVSVRDVNESTVISRVISQRVQELGDGGDGDTCFVAGTLVRLSDGSDKKIEEVKIGDILLGVDESHNTVVKFDHHPLNGRNLIGINGSGPFKTPEHPLMTKEGWKAYNSQDTIEQKPQIAHLMVNGNLEVGDEIKDINGNWVLVESLEVFENEEEQLVYNFCLDGNNTYYADGLLAHNRDPLSQSFTVGGGPRGNDDGRFVTSIDVFFSAKDATLPCQVEIRNMVNGYPGRKILPFGKKILYPSDINTSTDGSTATTFTFDSPVFLQPDTEYCFVLFSHSPEYKVWISRMGENDIGDTRIISEQPHIGVLFKSSNNLTWNASQLEDLKFSLKVANFDTTAAGGTLTLVNSTLPTKTLDLNPIVMTGGSTTLQVKHFDHHMYSTSNNVTISGVSSGITTTLSGAINADAATLTLADATNFDDTSGKFSRTAANEYHIKIDDEIMKYTTVNSTTGVVTSLSRGQQGTTAATHADGSTVELFMIHKVPLYEINKTHTSIANIGIDSYTVTISTAPVTDGSTGVAEIGGSTVTATENSIIDYFRTEIANLVLPRTSISANIRPTTATSPSGTQTSFSTLSSNNARTFPLNENYKFDDPFMICSGINETNELSGLKSLFVDLNLKSTSSNVSPVIDLQRTSIFAIANRLDNIDSSADVFPTTDFVASTEPDGDSNTAIYLTKQVTLENPATALKVLFGAHRPSTSEIKVMYKILRTDDSSDFDDLGYRFFNTTGVDDNQTPASADENDFKEYVYTAGVTDDGLGDPLEEFISFQIKIIMQGTNCAEPPRIKELRALALVT